MSVHIYTSEVIVNASELADVCSQVYESCEALFASLADEAKTCSDWLVLLQQFPMLFA
jgi:hypothetical protein